jgi:hypothetical protein
MWSSELAINYFSLFPCQWENKYYALDGVKATYFQLRGVISIYVSKQISIILTNLFS